MSMIGYRYPGNVNNPSQIYDPNPHLYSRYAIMYQMVNSNANVVSHERNRTFLYLNDFVAAVKAIASSSFVITTTVDGDITLLNWYWGSVNNPSRTGELRVIIDPNNVGSETDRFFVNGKPCIISYFDYVGGLRVPLRPLANSFGLIPIAAGNATDAGAVVILQPINYHEDTGLAPPNRWWKTSLSGGWIKSPMKAGIQAITGPYHNLPPGPTQFPGNIWW